MRQAKIFYDQLASEHGLRNESTEGFSMLETRMLFKILHTRKQRTTLLDVGCGKARKLRLISGKRMGVKSYGIDISKQTLRKARLKKGSFQLIQASFGKIPFRDSTFDYVIAMGHVMGHVDCIEDFNLAFKEVFRVLKSSGFFLCSMWNLFSKFVWNDEVALNSVMRSGNEFMVLESRLRGNASQLTIPLLFTTREFLLSSLSSANLIPTKVIVANARGELIRKNSQSVGDGFIIANVKSS